MLEDDQKLRVPDPDEPETPDTRGEIFVLAAAVSILAGLAFFLDRYERAQRPDDGVDRPAEASADDPPLADRAGRLHDYTTRGGLDDYQWRPDDILAALRHGPRGIATVGCRTALRDRPDELLDSDIRRELLTVVDRRADHVPWSCLFRALFEHPDRLGDQLTGELREIWATIRTFDETGGIAETVAGVWADTGYLPDDPGVRRWARLCALHFDRSEGFACRELLAERAPEQGTDLLDVLEVHLRETDLNPSFDLPILVDALERLATQGQPPGWRIEETDTLPDYDTDLRIGAIFYLCRMVNSPTDSVARQSAEALSHVADYGVRAGDDNLRDRWLAACRHAFDISPDDPEPSAPALAVWNGNPDDPPRYALRSTIDRGDCRVRPDHPRWYCGSAKYDATSPAELTDFFVDTRHMNWDDPPRETR